METAEQRDFLLERGCELGQGYFFSRPPPPSEVPAYLPPVQAPLRTASGD